MGKDSPSNYTFTDEGDLKFAGFAPDNLGTYNTSRANTIAKALYVPMAEEKEINGEKIMVIPDSIAKQINKTGNMGTYEIKYWKDSRFYGLQICRVL